MFNQYRQWLDSEGIKIEGFKGFVANRFGRIAHLARTFLEHRESITKFFQQVVDIHSNKLVLAVSTYIDNDWFRCCAEVYAEVGDIIIFPLMKLLRIDENKHEECDRSWNGIRDLFGHKLPEMKTKRDNLESANTGKDRLLAAVLDEGIDTLERQLSQMDFGSTLGEGTASTIDEAKLEYAPLTNLGCEGEFAKLDNRIKFSGGSTTIVTHSRKINKWTTGRYSFYRLEN